MSAGDDHTRRVAVVGCGLIGASWTALFLASGIDVDAYDPDAGARAAFGPRVRRALEQLSRLGPVGTGEVREAASLAEAIAGADFIQENAPENAATKRELYQAIEAGAPAGSIIASSTSAMLWSDLAREMAEPTRLIVAHPYNPAHLVPLVEIFGTDREVVDRAAALYRRIGKTPVVMKREAVGHIANRLASALYREAVHIAAEGIADVADVDAALVEGPGLRWATQGPHMTYHLGGGGGGIQHYLAHLGASQQARWETLGAPTLTDEVKAMLVDGVLAEAAGRSIADLEEERDEALLAMLACRRKGQGGRRV